MRWPWMRNRAKDEEALKQARRQLADVREHWPRVHRASQQMVAHKQRNNFAPNIEAIYRTRRHP